MKKVFLVTAAAALLSVSVASAFAADWNTFVIRNAADGTAPAINDVVKNGQNAKAFVINKASQKAAWGTSSIDGFTIGQIASASINRLDDITLYTTGSGPYCAPYVNIWVTNGAGKYALVANEPSNAEWAGQSEWNFTWDVLKIKTLKVYETTDKSWLPNSGVGLKFQDIAGFKIEAPTVAALSAGWAGLGGGATRELGTNKAYGFNWVFGDSLANYVSGQDGYIVNNASVAAVPEPGSILAALSILGPAGIMFRRRKLA